MERKERRVLSNDEMVEIMLKMQSLIPSHIPGSQAYAICVGILGDVIVRSANPTDNETLDKITNDVTRRLKQYFKIVKEVDNEQE